MGFFDVDHLRRVSAGKPVKLGTIGLPQRPQIRPFKDDLASLSTKLNCCSICSASPITCGASRNHSRGNCAACLPRKRVRERHTPAHCNKAGRSSSRKAASRGRTWLDTCRGTRSAAASGSNGICAWCVANRSEPDTEAGATKLFLAQSPLGGKSHCNPTNFVVPRIKSELLRR